jgi:hypothetical protein
MTVNCFKDFEDDYIIFSFNGDILLNNISDIPEQIISTLNEYTTRKILIDFTAMKSEFYLLDFIKIVRTIHKEFNSIRIGIVDNSKEIKDSETIEAILFNNGIILRIFKSTDEAKKWISN